jgi:hypothetical protein
VHRGRRPLKELGKKIYKSGGDHYNKTKKGIKQKKKRNPVLAKVLPVPPNNTHCFSSHSLRKTNIISTERALINTRLRKKMVA